MVSTNKLVVALLILAILFSAASIFISISASKLFAPQKQVSGYAVSESPVVSLYVEGNNPPPGS